MSYLIRLYPRAWRERYDDELAALLDDRPLGRADVVDLLLGAFDAHVHYRRSSTRDTRRETTPMRIRSGHPILLLAIGLAFLATAYGLIIGIVTLANPDPLRWAGWGPAGFTVAAALLLAGLAVSFWRPAAGALLGAAGAVLLVAAAPWLWMFAIGFGVLAAVPCLLRYRRTYRTADPA